MSEIIKEIPNNLTSFPTSDEYRPQNTGNQIKIKHWHEMFVCLLLLDEVRHQFLQTSEAFLLLLLELTFVVFLPFLWKFLNHCTALRFRDSDINMEPALADSDEVNCLEPSKCQEKENNASVSPDDERRRFTSN